MAVVGECDKLQRDIDAYSARVYKANRQDLGYLRLPKCWNIKDRSRILKLSHFLLTVSYGPGYSDRHDSTYNNHELACVRSDVPIPLATGIYYYEVTISSKGTNGWSLSVGVQQKNSSLSKFPGSEHSSFGYHSDGSIYHWSTASAIKFGPRLLENDTVGCGIDFISRSLFFTRNGVFLGKAFEGKIPVDSTTRLYPAVGLQGRGARVTANFGQRPFNYTFDVHIKRERALHENQLIERSCKEEFTGPKMRDLVSGYLVHHGYMATAQAFSRWASIPNTSGESQPDLLSIPTSHTPVYCDKSANFENVQSRSCEAHIGSSPSKEPFSLNTLSQAASLPRRHSDSSCFNATNVAASQLPGFASMLHRRRLRALCRRYQYGRAAATLNRLYPQVLERCPELLVQLRCRQLIEMMRRHAVRRDRSCVFDRISEPIASSSATVPHKIKRFDSEACCVRSKFAKLSKVSPESMSRANQDEMPITVMEVDEQITVKCDKTDDANISDAYSHPVDDLDDDGISVGLDEEDDDDFGLDDDTGVCVSSLLPAWTEDVSSHNALTAAVNMDVDTDSSLSTSTALLGASDNAIGKNEMLCLLAHIQFGRSLVNLVKQVRTTTGGLSLETERLLQQSVSLLAYSSPTSVDCPLRGLLDPAWRDTIANVINSAVLKAHDLPIQPALEQGLLALQRCFNDPHFAEAQTLGHFLLYHLTPSQLTKAEQEAAAALQPIAVRNRSAGSSSLNTDTFPPNQSNDASQKSDLNGYVSDRRRLHRRDRRLIESDDSQGERSVYDAEGYSSSLDDVFGKEDEEEEEEEEEGEIEEENPDDGACHLEDDSTNDDDDDDDDEQGDNPASLSSHRRTRDRPSGGSRGGSNLPIDRSPNGDSPISGRTHSATSFGERHPSASLRSFFSDSRSHGRPYRHTVFTRYCPSLFLEPSRTRVISTVPSSASNSRRLTIRTVPIDRFSAHTNSIPTTRSTRLPETEAPPNQYLDSGFNGLLSMSYPQHAEFLSAMNDALKAYAGTLLLAGNDFSSSPSFTTSEQRRHRRRDDAPGDSACAP